jgi:hypothetical protein
MKPKCPSPSPTTSPSRDEPLPRGPAGQFLIRGGRLPRCGLRDPAGVGGSCSRLCRSARLAQSAHGRRVAEAAAASAMRVVAAWRQSGTAAGGRRGSSCMQRQEEGARSSSSSSGGGSGSGSSSSSRKGCSCSSSQQKQQPRRFPQAPSHGAGACERPRRARPGCPGAQLSSGRGGRSGWRPQSGAPRCQLLHVRRVALASGAAGSRLFMPRLPRPDALPSVPGWQRERRLHPR